MGSQEIEHRRAKLPAMKKEKSKKNSGTFVVGIDAGSVSLNSVVLNSAKEFVYESPYRRHLGRVEEEVSTLLQEIHREFGEPNIKGIAFTGKARPYGGNRFGRSGENSVFRGDPAQRHTGFYLLYVPGALLGANPAGRTEPHIFGFNLRQTEYGLPDQLAHAESANPVPGTNGIA